MSNDLSISNSQSPPSDFQVKPIESAPKIKGDSQDQQDQPQPQSQQEKLSKDKTEKVIQSMNGFLKESNTHLEYKFHDGLKKYYVAIVDDRTNEVVKEIPSKKLLDIYATMNDYLGLLLDEKA